MFDVVFYHQDVWRRVREPMQQYISRRDRDFEGLRKVSDTTLISDDIKAHLLLKFSRIPPEQQSNIVSSSGNAYDLTKFKTAMRMQHHNIHEKERDRPQGRREPRTWAADEEDEGTGAWECSALVPGDPAEAEWPEEEE